MKKSILLGTLMVFVSFLSLQAQGEKTLPSAVVKNLDGQDVNAQSFENDGKPIVVSFWATWCKPCILELTTIQENYPDWQAETGVKLIAISIDDARNSAKVRPFVEGRGWEYEVYIDANQDLKRAMGVNQVPHTFVINGKGEIVHSHQSYQPGDEEELYDHLIELAAGEE